MTKQEVLVDAQKYANTIKLNVYLIRRGNQYKATRNDNFPGWKLAEIVMPNNAS